MTIGSRHRQRGFTLYEVVLVVGILALLSAMIVPNFMRQLRSDALPRSARQFRSLLNMVRARAALEGKRYRLRFPEEDELDALGGERQPVIERENDPIDEPEVFSRVEEAWAQQRIFLAEAWCAQVRLGRPSIARLQAQKDLEAERLSEALEETVEEMEPDRPPLFVEPDGSSEWATFLLTLAPRDTTLVDLEDHPRLEVILDGATGMAWLQRPFYEEELDLFEEKGWPAVLRQDFTDKRMLTEDDVLELRESQIRGKQVQRKARGLEAAP